MGFLRSAYLLGIKCGQDQSMHLMRGANQTKTAVKNKLENFRRLHRVALAFSEVQHASRLTFDKQVVEPDSARLHKRHDEQGHKVHSGRTLVVKARESKQWLATPLPPKVSRGKCGHPPESTEEAGNERSLDPKKPNPPKKRTLKSSNPKNNKP